MGTFLIHILSETGQLVQTGGALILPRMYTLPFGRYRISSSWLKYWLFTIDSDCSGACCFACPRGTFWSNSWLNASLSMASIFVKTATTGTAPDIPVRYSIIVDLPQFCLPLPVPHSEKKLFSAAVTGLGLSTGMQYLYHGRLRSEDIVEIFAYHMACS
jgi:hypothetical protein